MSTFQVLIKGRKEFIDFNGICTNIDYSNNKMCVFEHVTSDKKKKVLAIIPYENIEYVRNYPYSKED